MSIIYYTVGMTFRRTELYPVYLITFLFFLAYCVLSLTRHAHLESFGFDLGIADQLVWLYSRFLRPVTTIDHVPFISGLSVHVELIYLLLSPVYWIRTGSAILILLQTAIVTSSGIAVYLLARRHTVSVYLAIVLQFGYLMFYGVQQALWFDVHSAAFGTAFLAWFIYYVDSQRLRPAVIAFILTVSCKENFAAMTMLVSLSYLIVRREKRQLLFIGLSGLYLLVVFGVYFGTVVPGGYRFADSGGLFAGMKLSDLFNTPEKRQVWFYTLAWTGFLSVIQPVFLLPVLGNLASYFILGRNVTTAQGLFLQYRIELAPLVYLATVYGLDRLKRFSPRMLTAYLGICVLLGQYVLHLPLSYLAKSYFWHEPASVSTVNTMIPYIPADASVVAQNNIVPHISDRKNIFTLWPEKKDFTRDPPCSQMTCDWFRWAGKPAYLLVDTDSGWDTRHLLTDRTSFMNGLRNLESAGVIRKYKELGTTVLYAVK